MPLEVSCQPTAEGWSCRVRVGDDEAATQHEVAVSTGDFQRLARPDEDPTDLVRASFAFLLEREPRESILRRFDLRDIGRYFPEWESQIRRPAPDG